MFLSNLDDIIMIYKKMYQIILEFYVEYKKRL